MIILDLLVYTFSPAAFDGYLQQISQKVGYFNTIKRSWSGMFWA